MTVPDPTSPHIETAPSGPSLLVLGTALLAVVAIIVASLTLVVVIAGADSDPAGSSSSADPQETTIEVALSEFALDGDFTAPAGQVVLAVTNDGSVPHDLTVAGVEGAQTPMLAAGETARLDLGTLEPGTYELSCTVPGHGPAGMTGTLTITDTDTGTGTEAAGDEHGTDAHEGGDRGWKVHDQAMADSVSGYPVATEGTGAPLAEFTVAADGAKEFRLVAQLADWEVAPGKIVEAWTYNGVVPGPTIKVGVGDRVRVIVDNELPMSTDVHWHGIKTPFEMDGVAPITQDFIEPGQSFTYDFVATSTAVGMYHPHHHGFTKISDGMFGSIVVGELPLPGGVTADQELSLVINDGGEIGYALNGKSFPATAPIVASQGDRVLVHYYNSGATSHPMHLHQMEQLVVAKDGFPLASPYLADTVNVAPGERLSVLIDAHSTGTWLLHCHILSHVEGADGIHGMATAMVVS